MPSPTDKSLAVIASVMQRLEAALPSILPTVCRPERMLRIVDYAMRSNPALLTCTPRSLAVACMNASYFGLEPNTPEGKCFIIPRKVKGNMTACFQLGYLGLVELAYRAGVNDVRSDTVRANDDFQISLGTSPGIKHIPANGDRGDVVGYYAVVRMTPNDPLPHFAYMTQQEVIAHAAHYSDSYRKGGSAWQTSEESMALKTVVIKALKLAPKSVEDTRMRLGIAADETVEIRDANIPIFSGEDLGLGLDDLDAGKTEGEKGKGAPDEEKEVAALKEIIGAKCELSGMTGEQFEARFGKDLGEMTLDELGACAKELSK